MMKNVLRALLTVIAVTALVAIDVSAQGFYTGLNYVLVSYEESAPGLNFDADPGVLRLDLGYKANQYLSLEARIGFGVSDDSEDVLGVSVDVEVNEVYGLYVKGHLPIGDAVNVYGIAGYTKGELEASTSGISVTEDESDFSYGIGADYNFHDSFAVSVEFAQLIDKSNVDVTGLSVGFRYFF